MKKAIESSISLRCECGFCRSRPTLLPLYNTDFTTGIYLIQFGHF